MKSYNYFTLISVYNLKSDLNSIENNYFHLNLFTVLT